MAAEFTPDSGEGTGLDEAIAAYLAACEVEGKTRRTVQAYAETLRRFRAICAAEGLPDRVAAFRPAHIYAFLKVISDSGVSLGTRHRRFRRDARLLLLVYPDGRLRPEPVHGHPERQSGAEG